MDRLKTENKKWLVSCTNSGLIEIQSKIELEDSFSLQLFNDKFQYLYIEWGIIPNICISPDSEYVIVTYGVGYVYFIRISEKKVVKSFQLFSDITYEDNSFQYIDMCCYYNERTQIDFSNTGSYAAIRVRGDYDPQESDGREHLFTPVYFRSIFVIDLSKLEICFQDNYGDVAENGGRNVASIAFSPKDDYLVTGVLGNVVKVFSLRDGTCFGKFSSLVWISNSCAIRDCPLIIFLDENNFIYVNKKNNLIRVTKQGNQHFEETGIIRTGVPEDQSTDVYDKWSYIYKIMLGQNEIVCYTNGNRKEYKLLMKFKLRFDAIE